MKIDTWETAVLHTKGVPNGGMPPFCPHHDADWTASVHLERATKTQCIVFSFVFVWKYIFIFHWCKIQFLVNYYIINNQNWLT